MAPLMFFRICRSAWLAEYRNSRYSEMGSSPDRMLASFRNRVRYVCSACHGVRARDRRRCEAGVGAVVRNKILSCSAH